MSYTPPPSPGSLRSPRKRALEIGTDRMGFEPGPMEYHTQAGVPMAASGGTYQSAGPFVSTQGGPINTPTPFANLKK
jgi:hypothetical protein